VRRSAGVTTTGKDGYENAERTIGVKVKRDTPAETRRCWSRHVQRETDEGPPPIRKRWAAPATKPQGPPMKSWPEGVEVAVSNRRNEQQLSTGRGYSRRPNRNSWWAEWMDINRM